MIFVSKINPMKKVLFVLTSNGHLGNTGEETGFWLDEFTTPYYHLSDNDIEVVLCSPKGGQPPIDPKSSAPESQTVSTTRFEKDRNLQEKLSKTLKLKSVSHENYDAIFFPGGHGVMWDLTNDGDSDRLIESFYKTNKPVATVCHSPAVLKNAKSANGVPIVNGKQLTGFSNSEEKAIDLANTVPFLLEDELKSKGAIFSSGNDWQAYAQEDGLLISGQNPASSILVAHILLNKLND